FQLGQRDVERALRFKRPLTAIMLDIDHFKNVNDTHGHPAGDRVLRALTECCRENVRTIDIVGRYGGEEFVLLLPETDLTDAIQVAERLRVSAASASVSFGRERLRFTISLGIAELTADIPNLAALIERADQAQYLAKQSGRNRVRVYQ
ncbi:MAG: GGDEF domain-containing protein, partial [Chloroflexota bacterium]